MIRATAANGQIRAFACTSKKLAEEGRKAHNTSPVVTAALGRLMSAGVMMGWMLKNDDDLITLKINGDGPVRGITVTADSKGNVKGFPYEPLVLIPAKPNGKLDVSGAIGNGILTVIKDMGMGEPYSGQIELQTGEIAEDITYYFAASEQVPSGVGLGVLMNKDNTVRQAGGFIVQLMPFAEEGVIERLEENLKQVASVTSILDSGKNPEEMLGIILEGFDIEINEKKPIQFSCSCSKERTAKALIAIGRKELRSLIEEGETIEMNCQFCGKHYYFTVEELQALYTEALKGIRIIDG